MTTATLGGWLVHVMRSADGALSLEEALHVVMDSMKAYFPCQSVAVLLIDQDTKELRIKISRQISYTFVKKFKNTGPSPTAEKVVLEQHTMLLNGLAPDSVAYTDLKLEHEFASAVLAPVVKNQRGVGYIFADRTAETDAFKEADELHLQVIGYLIGNLIEKFELIQQSKRLSQIDDASGALQYKAFIPALATELERATTHDYPVHLALFAVNAFRSYIETFGIDAAHELLAEVVTIIREHTESVDVLARFGADELILCLSGRSATDAEATFEALLSAIGTKAVGQGDGKVSVTLGVLALTTSAHKKSRLQDILANLGRQLVAAKGQGADQLVIGDLD